MGRAFQALLLVLARATNNELARQVQFLKVENDILRGRLPKSVSVTPKERARLLKFGKPLGSAIQHLISIVSPRTFMRWVSDAKKSKKPAQPGRPRKRLDLRKLIVKIAQETGWGYTRILGEIRKLTTQKVSRQFVINVMKEHGFDPGPKRGEKTWDEFLKIHAHTLWQCDFFSKRAVTLKGIRDLFVVVFIHVGTRRIFVTKATANPTAAWVKEQAQLFCDFAKSEGLGTEYVYHDRDSKFSSAFDESLAEHGASGRRSAYRSPNLQAYVERFVQSIETKCLDHFIVLGESHLNYLTSAYVRYYSEVRPHQGLDNKLLVELPEPGEDVPKLNELRCERSLGGLLKHYCRKAACFP